MRKLFALYTNEWIKMARKASVIVLASLIVLSAFAIPAISKAISMLNQMSTSTVDGYFESQQTWMEDESRNELLQYDTLIKEADLEIEKIQESEDYPEETKKMLISNQEEQKAQYNDTLEIYTLAINNGIYPQWQNNYLTESIAKILEMRSIIRSGDAYLSTNPSTEIEQQINSARSLEEKFQNLIENPDFPTYIALESERIDLDPNMSSDEKQNMKELLEIRRKLQPEGDLADDAETSYTRKMLSYITAVKTSVMSGLDYTSVYSSSAMPMNPETKAMMIDREMIIDYRIANDIFPSNTSYLDRMNTLQTVYSAGMFLITILVMILAGSSISQELATGSIKSLIIAPVRRWKIFAAKLLSLLSLAFITMLILYVCGFLAQGIFQGFSGDLPYVYVSNGEIVTIPFPLYMLQYLFCFFPQVAMYLFLAFMLSVVTRNTAVSVALPLGFMFVGNIITEIIAFLPRLEIFRYIPYEHLNFTERAFPFSILMSGLNLFSYDYSMMSGGAAYVPPTISFSLIYLAVATVCIVYIAFDHFTRQDIR